MASVGGLVSRQKVFEITQSEKNKPCFDCGHKYNYWIMQFDHVKGKKKFNISRVGRQIKVTKRQLIEEIRKCQVVCANCHHERTYRTFKGEKVKMKMSVLRSEMRRANKEHICIECGGPIDYLESYAALIGSFDGKFSTVHLHTNCENIFLKKNHSTDTIEQGSARIIPDPKDELETVSGRITSPKSNISCVRSDISESMVMETTPGIVNIPRLTYNRAPVLDLNKATRVAPYTLPSLEGVQFKALLETLTHFHQRWQVEHSNSLEDRANLLTEENSEWIKAVKEKSNVLEELADQLAVVLGNILWSNINVDSSISIYGVMKYLEDKLRKRSKYGYKIQNIATGVTKMTHWQKVLHYLETDRVNWRVIDGPCHPHPEILELLTEQERGFLLRDATKTA